MKVSTTIALITSLPFLLLSCQKAEGQEHQYSNALVNESSPYLLQHAHNPVNWYPWGTEALQKAKREGKMLLISVGYAACHWCHVMERESFEDTTVSRVMNEHFVSIKVDREERPDVDDVYMTACHLASGQNCGWPLNAFALPDGRPVWAGTYFPKKQWLEILEYFIKLYREEPEKLKDYATKITEGIQSADDLPNVEVEQDFDTQTRDQIAAQFFRQIDFKNGGRKGAPKFPMPNNYDFLLRYHYLTGDETALEAVTTTLNHMARGGIYDQLGGGFARYSTDDVWKVPHFEKMLYDNGQLVSLYSDAFRLTQNNRYQEIVEETVEYVRREMTASSGGFYSSIDADSDGEEGKFYTWTKSEIERILDNPELADLFCDFYSVTERGNWEHTNVLHHDQSFQSYAEKKSLSLRALKESLDAAEEKLFEERKSRIRPGLDDKILTSWNALMIKGYVDAYRALGHEAYLEAALKNAQFIVEQMMDPDFRLNRNYKDGRSGINAFLDDYALTSQAFIALYGVTFDETWLYQAKGLIDYALEHFSDEESVLFNYTSSLDPPLVARKMEIADNVIPASNSVMGRVLFQLGTYLYNQSYLNRSRKMLSKVVPQIIETETPSFYSNWCTLFAEMVEPPYEIAIIGPDYEPLRAQLMAKYLPNTLFLGGKTEGSLELLKDKLQPGETYIYVCRNKVCKLPVTNVEAALEQIR